MSKSNSAVLKIMWKRVEPQKKSTTSNPFYWILKDKKANTMSAGYVLFRLDLPLNMKPAAAGDPEAKADSCIHSLLTASTSKLQSVHALAAVISHSHAFDQC